MASLLASKSFYYKLARFLERKKQFGFVPPFQCKMNGNFLKKFKIPSVIRRVEEVVDERMLNLLSEIIMSFPVAM